MWRKSLKDAQKVKSASALRKKQTLNPYDLEKQFMATGAQLSGRENYSLDTDDPFGKKFSFGLTKDQLGGISPKYSKYKDKIIDRLSKPKDMELVPCPNCGRKFYPSRLVVHMRGCKTKSTSPIKSKNLLKSQSTPFVSAQSKHRFGASPSPLDNMPNLDIKEVYRQKYSYNKPNDYFDSKGLPRAKTIGSFRQSTYRGDPRSRYNDDEATETNVFDQSLCNDLQRLLEEDTNPAKIEKKRKEWNTGRSDGVKKVLKDIEFLGSFNRGRIDRMPARSKERSPFTRTGVLKKEPLPHVPINRKAVTPNRTPVRGSQAPTGSKSLNRLTHDSDPVHMMVVKIFQKYDTNKSGSLSRKETLNLVNDIFAERGKKPATVTTFNKIFSEFNQSKNGILSKTEVARFVRKFMMVPSLEEEVLDIVNQIWYDFDTDRSGQLNRKETLRFIKSFMAQKGMLPPSYIVFSRYFNEMDINKDGFISKKEMALFMMNFVSPRISNEQIVDDMVYHVFQKYDTDMSGALNRRETLRLINDLRAQNGQRPATHYQFQKLFNEFDFNGDGVLSRKEMTEFVRKFLRSAEADDEEIRDMVERIWYKFDIDRSGQLNRRETLRFLNAFFKDQGQPPLTSIYFNRLFAEFDLNGDNQISKAEMARFVVMFMNPKISQDDMINDMVLKIFQKYDTDMSGALNRRETLKVVNDIYASEGRRPVTNTQFNRIFNEFDVNGDGQLTQKEMTRFVIKFLHIPVEVIKNDTIADVVNSIWYRYDKDRSGKLNRRETLKFLNEFLAEQGRPPTTVAQFNQFFVKFDVNKDGQISKIEMAQFVRLFVEPNADELLNEKVYQIFDQYDTNGSGYLEKRETLRLVNDILASRGQRSASISLFNGIFAQYDTNGDGVLSKSEMKRFVRNILGLADERILNDKSVSPRLSNENDIIVNTVNRIWFKFDTDRSGKLNRRETLRFLNAFMLDQGKPAITNKDFTKFFAEFDVDRDGYISKPEMARFVRLVMMPKEDPIGDMVNRIFDSYDTNCSNTLSKRNVLKLVNDILKSQGKRPPSNTMFYQIFNEFDKNGDGVLSRREMRSFVSKFLDIPSIGYHDIIGIVNQIWREFDKDRSGKLNRRETLRFLNSFLSKQGQATVNNLQFNKFFVEFDVNKDGFISKPEMSRFIGKFFDVPSIDDAYIDKVALSIFDMYDSNKNGYLDRKEALGLINEILAQKGLPQSNFSQFKKIYSQLDTNGDGVISRREVIQFVRLYLGKPFSLKQAISDTINQIWYDYDTDRSGKLNRRETLRFLNAFLQSRGYLDCNAEQFSSFYDKFDVNRDGYISKSEMARFVGQYMAPEMSDEWVIEDMVQEIFAQYDTNGSGVLDKRETKKLVNDILSSKGKRPVSYTMFKRIFQEFDDNGDNVLSQQEMIRFVKQFMNIKPSEDDLLIDTVHDIWVQFDTDRSGNLNRMETLKFLNAFLKSRGKPPTTNYQFKKFFEEFDVNKDGLISKQEMAQFVKMFMVPLPSEDEEILVIVNEIWYKFDTDRSGKLNRMETLQFLNAFLLQRGRPPTTNYQFQKFYEKFDVNKDGYISKSEMAQFVKLFMVPHAAEDEEIIDIVHEIWFKFDTDRSGKLNRKETLKFLNAFLESRGSPPTTHYQFKKFFEQFDVNKDGFISQKEMAQFVKLFIVHNLNESDVIIKVVNEIWYDFDTDRSGKLSRRETLRFLNAFLGSRGQPPTTNFQFKKFFDKFDVNKDGLISKAEMAQFVQMYMASKMSEEETMNQMVNDIWYNFDTDRSGKLNRKETLKFLNAFLKSKGKPPTTNFQFKQFFENFDANGDGFISKSEMTQFVQMFMVPNLSVDDDTNDDILIEMVDQIFIQYDKDNSGQLDRYESYRLINDVLSQRGQGTASRYVFNRIFEEFDVNGDKVLSRAEIFRFVKSILGDNTDEIVKQTVHKIWKEFDTDRSGKLNKKETLRFLNAFLASQGMSSTTVMQFNRFFKEFDVNKDGFISKSEMARFVRQYIEPPEHDPIDDMVQQIFLKYDKNNSGNLSRSETLKLLNDYLHGQGKRAASYSLFNRFFNEFDENGDGVLSQSEMKVFVKKFLVIEPSEDDDIMDVVDEIWDQFDTDRSGKLNRRETQRFLNSFKQSRGQPAVTHLQFSRFFKKFDANGDGYISKNEMAQFVKMFMAPVEENDLVNEMVQEIFAQYDTDGSGTLERRETISLVNDILAARGQRPVTYSIFNKFFQEFDQNGDGVLSQREMGEFVKKFFGLSDDDYHNYVMDIVDEIWDKFDTDRSGLLNRRETLRFIIHFLTNQGQSPPTNIQFNRFFSEFDVNKDGQISKSEMAQFVLKFMAPQVSHDDFIKDMVENIFVKYDTDNNRFLEKNEVLKLLDEILSNQGMPQTSIDQFNEFFAEFDSNGDGVISKSECTRFVRKFLDNPNLFTHPNEETLKSSNNSINFTPGHQNINQLYNSDNFQMEELNIQVSKIDKQSIQNILENNQEQLDEFESNSSIIIMPNNPPVNDIPLHLEHNFMVQCPYCLRKFTEEAAKRHIPKCMKTKNRPRPPPSRNEVMEKVSARKKQQDQVREMMDSPTGMTNMNNLRKKLVKKNSGFGIASKGDMFTKKMSSTKDDVAGLVASGFVSELNNKQRVSPFPRKESQLVSKGSFYSKNSLSLKSSPNRGESPLFTQGAIEKQSGFQTQRNSMPSEPHNFRARTSSMIGKGVKVMACFKNKVTASSFNEKDSHQLKQTLTKPNMAAIMENFEEGNKRTVKKEWAHSDVKTRMQTFASIQCPQCLRKFSEKAADAHIAYCTKKAKRLPINTSPVKKSYENSMSMNPVNDSRAKTARFDRNYYSQLQRRNNIKDYKNIQSKINSGLLSIDYGTSSNLEFKNNERMVERMAAQQTKYSKNGYRLNNNRVESPIMAKYRNSPKLTNSHNRQTPAFEQDSSMNFTSKFCTGCGARFTVESHRFCGECGQAR